MSKTAEELHREADEMIDEMLREQTPEQESEGIDQPEQSSEDTASQQQSNQAEQTQTVTEQVERDPLEIANERVANAQRKMTEATQETASLRRQVSELNQKIAQLTEQFSSPSDSSEIDSLTDLANEYPDIVAPMLDRIRQLEGKLNEVDGKFEHTESQQVEQRAAAERETHFNKILDAHPDAMALAQSNEMQVWLAGRPPFDNQILQNGTADDVNDLLTRFKAAQTPVYKESKLDQAKRLATPTPRSVTEKTAQPTFTRQQINSMSNSEFLRNEKAIDDAFADGRII